MPPASAADRARELVGPDWDTMEPGTRIALTVIAGEMDQAREREEELKRELSGVRKTMYGIIGTIVTAALANGVLTVLQ